MGMKPGSFCLVAVELDYLVRNGGIGTTNWHLIHLLAKQGWRVHVLYAYPVDDAGKVPEVRRRLADAGIGFTHVDEVSLSPEFERIDPAEPYFLRIGDKVCQALRQLNQQHHFDLVEFAEAVGLGFRSLQSKRAGLDFANMGLIVKLHSMARWLREGNQVWMSDCQELLLDHCEQQAFEQADFQVSPSRYLLDYAAQIGWRVRDDAAVIRYPFPQQDHSAPQWPAGLETELVFFGRLEPRKGLFLFIDALSELAPTIPVTFLGKDTRLSGGIRASDYIRHKLRGRPGVKLLTSSNREQAVRYLVGGNRLAILPSLVENYANAVIECVVNGIPFLASRAGGTPEIVPEVLHPHLLFDPTPTALVEGVNRYLAASEDAHCQWREQLQAATDVEQHNRQVVHCYEQMLTRHRQEAASVARPAVTPRVAVAVHVEENLDMLPAMLRSLAEQSHVNLEVHIVAAGIAASAAITADLRERYRSFTFTNQAEPGAWMARNRLLEATTAPYFLPLTADFVPDSNMVERLVQALERQPECSAMIGYVEHTRPSGKLSGARRPAGGPSIMGCLHNVWGESSGLFRSEALRRVGGFTPAVAQGCESDWPTYVNLTRTGQIVGVLPEHVGHYFQRLPRPSQSMFATHQQVLELFAQADLNPSERQALMAALVSMQQAKLNGKPVDRPLRHRLADRANNLLKKVPLLHPVGRVLAVSGLTAWRVVRRTGSGPAAQDG